LIQGISDEPQAEAGNDVTGQFSIYLGHTTHEQNADGQLNRQLHQIQKNVLEQDCRKRTAVIENLP
jgi:hypothetical protein